MIVFLGQSFHTPVLPLPADPAVNEAFLDGPGLIGWLETFYALGQPGVNREALRTEQFRQIVTAHLAATLEATGEVPFYHAAFTADEFATAEELLSRRDELLDAGYRLYPPATHPLPDRIRVLHELEEVIFDDTNELDLMSGPADRLNLLLAALRRGGHPQLTIHLYEPRNLLAPGVGRLLDRLAETGDTVLPVPAAVAPAAESDLARWQRALLAPDGERTKEALTGDGSLLLLRAERETHLAAYIARMLKDNPDWRPGVLMTVRNQILDNAIRMEGLPSLGVPSTSLARPSLQILKLITAFLWEPFEVQRIMEFVSLVAKPLEDRLANRIARHLADRPGLFGPSWYGMIQGFREEMVERGWDQKRIAAANDQYRFFFERNRYPRDGVVPKNEVRRLFAFLSVWAREEYDDRHLAAQCQRATELLDAQPETELTYLGVERLVRTIYQPAPISFHLPERGALRSCFAPAAVADLPGLAQEPLDRLIWWDFVEQESNYFFSRYYPAELTYLADNGVRLRGPDERNELAIWQQLRPVLTVTGQLVLCLPERVNGTAMEPHPLMGDLEAAFGERDLAKISVDIDTAERPDERLFGGLAPAFQPVPLHLLDPPKPLLKIDRLAGMPPRDVETPTALEDLLYYPYKWVFRHQLKLRSSPILSIAGENRLRGNLSHLLVERLLTDMKKSGELWARPQVQNWINEHVGKLLEEQGAVLLEYGQEPERVQFVKTMQYSAWRLVDHLRRGHWRIRASEEKVAGELDPLGGQPVEGRADLVLERGEGKTLEIAVVDLKWRGKTVFRNLLRNAEDIQLCLYAEFISQRANGAKVHTAYYVLRDALMLARNEEAFAEIETVASADEAVVVQRETIRKVRATHNWRWQQFADGLVEIRCAETLPYLEDEYQDLDRDAVLDMKTEDARFDDYRSLVGLVR